ncbi:hypothetical protein F4802DRAFT_544377 [Xylaria palmicola]|nr:hypothetical protein F4802DRAFT_544377 [Xylaria palmicola]
MADEEDPLGPQIKRMLIATAHHHSNGGPSDIREHKERWRLQNLSVATTSGDTLVVVGFPAGHFVDCDGYKWTTKEFLMDSGQLLATGSSEFARRLSPEAQAQAKRRLQRLSTSHPGAKYVLDLTPPAEGDELASLVARLSLSDGVREWWRAHYISYISQYLVSGHDDVCPSHLDVPLFIAGEDRPIVDTLISDEPRKIVDYCPIRHRAAILRLLMTIRHGDLVLNSASRTATMAVIAEYFDCVKVVRDHVLTWFMAHPKQDFITVNAEDALWIGWTLKLRSITRAAFRVLVTERAAEILDNNRAGHANKRVLSILGRPRGSVTEEQETCIQHAAQRLGQRAEDVWAQLMSEDVHKFLELKQWPESNPALCLQLCTYIHDVVKDATRVDKTRLTSYDKDRARFVPASNLQPTKDIYQSFSPQQRILTTQFWCRLNKVAMYTDTLSRRVGWRAILLHEAPVLFIPAKFHAEFLSAVLDLGARETPHEVEISIPQNGLLLTSLSDEELKFLPLWAGGLDDGTGGVYEPDIPDAERGFPIGPGPAFHTGDTVPDDGTSTLQGNSRDPTILTGTGTVSMTSGRSVNPAPSQTTGFDAEFAAAAARLSINTPNLVPQEDMVGREVPRASPAFDDVFDWTAGYSEHQDDDSMSDNTECTSDSENPSEIQDH